MLRMMLEDGGQDARPDNYTFSAMLRAVASSEMWALLPKVYRMMQRLQVSTGMAVAGRRGRGPAPGGRRGGQ